MILKIKGSRSNEELTIICNRRQGAVKKSVRNILKRLIKLRNNKWTEAG